MGIYSGKIVSSYNGNNIQLAFTCSNSRIKTLEKRCEICLKLRIRTTFSSISVVDFEQVNVSW